MPEERKPAWKTCLIVGCGAVLLLAVVGGVVVALNWKTISEGYRKASSTIGGLIAVQREVQLHTAASQVQVHVETTSGVEGTTLKIDIAGAPFLDQLDSEPAARTKALEIAVIARDALPPEIVVERYKIVFTEKVSVGITIAKSQTQVFAASELPPPVPR